MARICGPRPLIARKEKLREMLIAADDDRLRYSEEFPDPVKLLAVVEKMGLEGVVSKRADAPYRSGPQKDWVKVKARGLAGGECRPLGTIAAPLLVKRCIFA